jgi:hypothetical protein
MAEFQQCLAELQFLVEQDGEMPVADHITHTTQGSET